MSRSIVFDVPRPDKKISLYQLSKKCQKRGFLKIKEKILFSLKWPRKYVVLNEGCMYIFKNEDSCTCEKAFSLFGYNGVLKAAEVKHLDYAFKLCYALDAKEQMKYFSAESEEEKMNWMSAIREELLKVHNVDIDKDADTSTDDTEIPISTREYFDKVKEIYHVSQCDSDLESEYSYPDVTDDLLQKPGEIPKAPTSVVITDGEKSPLQNGSTKKPAPPKPPSAKPDLEKDARWTGSAEEGVRTLLKYGREGTYMIRKSVDDSDVLLVVSQFQPRKYKIFKENDRIFLESGQTFPSVKTLIIHYRCHNLPNREVKLEKPYSHLQENEAFV